VGSAKTCPRCRQVKPLVAFGVRRASRSGRKSWCRMCERARAAERYRERVIQGLCIECGRPAGRHPLCAACRDRRGARRLARIAAGRCAYCGREAVPGSSRCELCIARDRERQARRRRRLRGPGTTES
jgi:hypothetical protein